MGFGIDPFLTDRFKCPRDTNRVSSDRPQHQGLQFLQLRAALGLKRGPSDGASAGPKHPRLTGGCEKPALGRSITCVKGTDLLQSRHLS